MAQPKRLLANPTAATVCRVRIGPSEDPVPAQVLHLSASGAHLLLRFPVVPGGWVTVDLFNVVRLFTCLLPMRVGYCQEIAGDGFVVGGTFIRQLDDEEMRRLV